MFGEYHCMAPILYQYINYMFPGKSFIKGSMHLGYIRDDNIHRDLMASGSQYVDYIVDGH